MKPVPKYWCADTRDDIYLLRKTGKIKCIKSGNWWVNRSTPVGEDAEFYERKPYGGNRQFYESEIVGIEKVIK